MSSSSSSTSSSASSAFSASPAQVRWPYPVVRLKPNKGAVAAQGHPWIFSGALMEQPQTSLVRLASHDGKIVGVGSASPGQALAVRLFEHKDVPLDQGFFLARFKAAVSLRDALGLNLADGACRWVFGEGDGLPGLIVDRYADALVLQVGTAGLEASREQWWPALLEVASAYGITTFVERSKAGRKEEGLSPVNRILRGSVPGPVIVREGDARLSVNLLKGQKTGTFIDQREHRLALGRVAAGQRVLNVFGYTGGFSIHAGLAGAAHVTTLDISAQALELAQVDWALNGLEPARHTTMCADAFEAMRQLEPGSFDRVIVDPPAFAKHRKDVDQASRAYKDVFRLGAKLTAPQGMLWCYSCSSHMDQVRFQQIVWSAMLEAGRRAQVLGHLGQPADHPYAIDHPEGFYLKGLWLRFMD